MTTSDGVLSDPSGALVIKPCTAREVTFYESATAHPEFARWMPTFFGTLQLNDSVEEATSGAPAHNRQSSIVLQNLTKGFLKPCVLDIKLGAQLWDDEAPQDKRDRLDKVSDATTSRSLGFRVAGMRVWKGEGPGYRAYDKLYGRTFTAETVLETLKEYLASDISAEQAKVLAARFLESVTEIREVLEKQESRMYSASLLFVHEGDGAALDAALEAEKTRVEKPLSEDDDDEDEVEVAKATELKLIDFAHAEWTPGLGPDENALQGVRSVEKLLQELI